MSQSLLEILQQKQALHENNPSQPIKAKEYLFLAGDSIIEIPRGKGRDRVQFIIYDKVFSKDGVMLTQGEGNGYYGWVDDSGELKFEVRKIQGDYGIGLIGRDSSDYYLAKKEFVESLSSR